MRWFGRKTGNAGDPDPGAQQQISEFLDRDHPRSSLEDGDQIIVDPGQVLEKIAMTMERVDVDIDTPVSIDDMVSTDELMVLIGTLHLGPVLVVHVANTAIKIMSARYPAELVRRPLPPEYDLRKLLGQLTISDQQHEIAKKIFNQRSISTADLTEDDIAADLEPLGPAEQMAVFGTLFYMYGTQGRGDQTPDGHGLTRRSPAWP